ncbi:MAG: hypothetical protein FWD57_15570 [Polyangiaceae bacterium]|nr:hypothetical protein [Polyangiaceae bacterium]
MKVLVMPVAMRHYLILQCLLFGFSVLLVSQSAVALETHPADVARSLILELRLDEAAQVLDGGGGDTRVALERGRLLLYATRYEEAQKVLERSDVLATREGAYLARIARGSARAVAGAYEVHDLYRNVVVRVQDDRDEPLVPLICDVVDASRGVLKKGLGVELPNPMRIELVRDHFTLAAMTGLPEEAARKTGTVAVANWGRVTMVTPRSLDGAYAWMDTLAHELTHVALGKGTLDLAPLWLQEGVAKYFEKSWRYPHSYDDFTAADATASEGMRMGWGRDFDGIGQSVAMLPSPMEAMVVYAQVESFVRYLVMMLEERSLAEMVVQLRESSEGEGMSEILWKMTGIELPFWEVMWRDWLEFNYPDASGQIGFDSGGQDPVVMRNLRLGRLMVERGHGRAAAKLLDVDAARPHNEMMIRYLLATAHLQDGQPDLARADLDFPDSSIALNGEAFALRGKLSTENGDMDSAASDFSMGVSLNPWAPQVACEGLDEPFMPYDANRSWLCRSARKYPRR